MIKGAVEAGTEEMGFFRVVRSENEFVRAAPGARAPQRLWDYAVQDAICQR